MIKRFSGTKLSLTTDLHASLNGNKIINTSLTLQETVSKYTVKVKDGDKEVDEEVEVDTKKQTERPFAFQRQIHGTQEKWMLSTTLKR